MPTEDRQMLLVPPPRPDKRRQLQEVFTVNAQRTSFFEYVAKLTNDVFNWAESAPSPARERKRLIATVFSREEVFSFTASMVAMVIDNPLGLKPTPKELDQESRELLQPYVRAKGTCTIELGPITYETECPDIDEILEVFESHKILSNCYLILRDYSVCEAYYECEAEWCSWYGLCVELEPELMTLEIENCSPS